MQPKNLLNTTAVFLFTWGILSAHAADHKFVGPKSCQECHKAEYAVWELTKHATGFKEVHKSPKTAAILEAVGGDKNMRKNATCVQCHFTAEQPDDAPSAVVKSGVSCESCHGAASNWIKIHNDYGGADVKKENETAEHKAKRIAEAHKNGWLNPSSKYDIAANCMECHGLANTSIAPATFAKMLAAGHPFNADYELIRYSQGTVRHRFFPPDTTVNKEMTPAETAHFFIIGQAAKLVSATQVASKADDAAYRDAQKTRITAATTALSAVKDIPEVAALLAAPTTENAHKLEAAIVKKDLSAKVKDLLPKKEDYK